MEMLWERGERGCFASRPAQSLPLSVEALRPFAPDSFTARWRPQASGAWSACHWFRAEPFGSEAREGRQEGRKREPCAALSRLHSLRDMRQERRSKEGAPFEFELSDASKRAQGGSRA